MGRLAGSSALLAALALIGGCQTKSVNEMSYTEVKQYAASLVARCKAEGAKPGAETQACINQEARADEYRRVKNIQTRRRIGAALADAGEGMQRNAAIMSTPRPLNCTSTPSSSWVGGPVGQVRTTCY